MRSFFLGRDDQPRWSRPLLLVTCAVAATLYAWALSESGGLSSYYSAAVLSGTKSWKVAFFGSLDSAGFMTVDKPPLALWVMVLSARIFGLSTWALALPQVIEGVLTVAVLHATVRRAFGYKAAAIAGAVMALTPIVVATTRFVLPDTLLLLLLICAAYATVRALESGGTRRLLAARLSSVSGS